MILKCVHSSPANFLDVGGGATKENVEAAFRLLRSDPKVVDFSRRFILDKHFRTNVDCLKGESNFGEHLWRYIKPKLNFLLFVCLFV